MPEEMKPDGLGFALSRDPATLAAWQESRDLVERDVYDVNGTKLGTITRCFAEEGALTRCDVTLTPTARQVFGVDQAVAGVPAAWIAAVDGRGVRLRKAGEEVLHPEDPRPLGASRDLRGAPELPRKNR
jgi:hypothetical protein